MNTTNIPGQEAAKDVESPDRDGNLEKRKILQSLQLILKSPSFRNSERCKQFLTYVVENSIEGRTELLKERIIGVEVFRRSAGYATGDDPIVRVQAGEVRRRLQQFYEAGDTRLQVQIELPTGSYAPFFRFLPEAPALVEIPHPTEIPAGEREAGASVKANRNRMVLAGLVLTALTIFFVLYFRFGVHQQSNLGRFWAPASTSKGPILICLAQPIVYMPTPQLFQRYSATDPRAFRGEFDRLTKVIPFKPDEKIEWGQIKPADELGVAVGDVYAAERVTRFLTENHQKSQVRIGKNYSFEDLRTSPSVQIGAYNNRWALQLTSKLRFQFMDSDTGSIREQLPGGRIWPDALDENGRVIRDYAIVARLLDSETGQFTIVIAGIMSVGTQAAAELVTNEDALREALKSAPSGWENKNVEIVLESSVTDFVSSPPHVVATYFW